MMSSLDSVCALETTDNSRACTRALTATQFQDIGARLNRDRVSPEDNISFHVSYCKSTVRKFNGGSDASCSAYYSKSEITHPHHSYSSLKSLPRFT